MFPYFDYHDWLRLAVIVAAFGLAAFICAQLWKWNRSRNDFNLMEYFTVLGKDGKQHASRPALAEMVALGATTAAYLSTIAAQPDLFTAATAIYGSLCMGRGAFGSYLRSKEK